MAIVELLNEITTGTIHEAAIPVVEFTSELWQTVIQPIIDGGDYSCCQCCCEAICCFL